MFFGALNNISLSVYNHLRDLLVASGIGSGGVSGTFMTSYPTEDEMKNIKSISDSTGSDNEILLPVVAIEEGSLALSAFELGSKDRNQNLPFLVTIFAENKRQLNSLLDQVLFDIDRTIDYNDYQTNFSDPPKVGNLFVDPDTIRAFRVRSTDPNQQIRNQVEVFFEVNTK